MWWRTWQTYATMMTQMMMKVTTATWMMTTPLPKTKRIPILPTHKWKDGGYGQGLSHRRRSGFFVVVVLCMSFPQPWRMGVCFWCMCAFWAFFEHWCVCVE